MTRGTLPFAIVAVALLACTKGEDATTSTSSESKAAAASSSEHSSVSPAAATARLEIAPSLERSCRQICDRSVRLKCSNVDKCFPNCLAMGSATPCTDEMLRFFDCLVAQPLQNWECAPDGVAAIKRGLCDPEQSRTVACMEAKVR